MPLELAHSPDLEVGVDGSSPPLTGDICLGGILYSVQPHQQWIQLSSSNGETLGMGGSQLLFTKVNLAKPMGDGGC